MLSPVQSYGAVVIYLIALPAWYLAIGPYQAEIALNPYLDETGRRWWRIAELRRLFPWLACSRDGWSREDRRRAAG